MAVNKVGTIDDRVKVKTALMSVFDKDGLDVLARALLHASPDVRFLSTGGTHSALQSALGASASSALRQVSDYTGQPEMQGGLVKTLDFRIYLGLLSETYNAAHAADLERTGAAAIDMVVANLYPFEQTVAAAGATLEDARANVDIGGPCMVRAAAKNFHRVAVLTDPADYPAVIEEISKHGGALCLQTRYRLAQKAFRLIARYDEAIARYLESTPLASARGIYAIRNGD
jgi:phosphoribosylaminoimidazolecarboxamide formyltransferase / IMP cyclohydrolase